MKRVLLSIMLLMCSVMAHSQILLSQDYFIQERYNPASVIDLKSLTFKAIHRRQTFLQGDVFQTNYFSVGFPFFNRSRKWSAINISFYQNNTDNLQIFQKNEVYGNYAVGIDLTEYTSLSMGVGFNYSNYSVDLSGLTTASQYLAGQGFDISLPNGEILNTHRSNNGSFGFGTVLQKVNKKNQPLLSTGISFLNFRTFKWGPDDTTPEKLLIRGNGLKWFDLNRTTRLAGELIYNYQNTVNSFAVGPRLSHTVRKSYRNPVFYGEVLAILRYDTREFISTGIQLEKEQLTINLAFDFYWNKAINNAIEVGVSFHLKPKRLPPKRRPVRRRPPTPIKSEPDSISRPDTVLSPPVHSTDTVVINNDSEIDNGYDVGFALDRLYILYFQFGEFDLSPNAIKYLDQVVKELKKSPSYLVNLYGHTDNIGDASSNILLSVERANSVKNYLLWQGIDEERIKVFGEGESRPLAPNDTREGRNVNRRVEIKVVDH